MLLGITAVIMFEIEKGFSLKTDLNGYKKGINCTNL